MIFLFIDIKFKDVLDVLLVAFILYQLFQLTRGTAAIKIFLGLALIYLLWKIVDALQMNLLGEILGQLMGVGVIAIIIVFQQELRQFLLFIGNREFFKTRNRFLRKLLPAKSQEALPAEEIAKACVKLASSKTGALIVFQRSSPLESMVLSKRLIDARITSALLQSIFFKNSPLHDGAVLVIHQKVAYASAVLPVTQRDDLPVEMGMRHRAALGLCEETDARAIVISEETGHISFVEGAHIHRKVSAEKLIELLLND